MTSLLTRLGVVAEEIAGDVERKAARRAKKRQWAECQMLLKRAEIEQQSLADIDRRMDEAANTHQATCVPLQARRAKIESEITGYLTDGGPVPSQLESDQVEVMHFIDAANSRLESELKVLRDLRSEKVKAIRDLQVQAAHEQVYANELASYPLANPQLLLKKHSISESMNWLSHRRNAANGQVQRWQHEVDKLTKKAAESRLDDYDRGQFEMYSRRLERWEFELSEAGAACAAANEESARVREEMLAE